MSCAYVFDPYAVIVSQMFLVTFGATSESYKNHLGNPGILASRRLHSVGYRGIWSFAEAKGKENLRIRTKASWHSNQERRWGNETC